MTEQKQIDEAKKRMLSEVDLEHSIGPVLHEEIANVNKAVIDMIMAAAYLGDAEPLGPVILGLPREVLDELAQAGRAGILRAQTYGLPLVEMRIKDVNVFKSIIQNGFGSADAVAAITRSMPIELITKRK